ncbi:MAG: hypothetical protein U5K28_08795 [Halobacteriales archaeon]|nr:hypothetical protein [Halobacteriales archaeon]
MVQCWLVERSYGSRNLITLVYATPDGERQNRKEMPITAIRNGAVTVTAATDVAEENLTAADDPDRYRQEVERVRRDHDPDDEL